MPNEQHQPVTAKPARNAAQAIVVEKVMLQDPPDPEAFLEVRDFVRRSATARKSLDAAAVSLKAKPKLSDDDSVRLGAALCILGRHKESRDVLAPLRSNLTGSLFLGTAVSALGRWSEAVEILEKTANRKPNSIRLKLEYVRSCLDAGMTKEASQGLSELGKSAGGSSDAIVLKGRLLDLQGQHDEARDTYSRAAEADSSNGDALFRLAYSLDLYGDDEDAINTYIKCIGLPSPDINALINLGVLYEDEGDYDSAINCYNTILDAYPNHPRAQAFLKDAYSSLDEQVDEERERLEDKRLQTLKIPITDFELSVRSRNCLNKMHIKSLGDLVTKTEAELLSYKNFGETSLTEIKAILHSKGLRLGLKMDESDRRERRRQFDKLFEAGTDEDIRIKPISELNLSIRSRRAMETLGVVSVGDLMNKSEKELVTCKNFGQTSLMEVKRKLAELGVSLTPSGDEGAEAADEGETALDGE